MRTTLAPVLTSSGKLQGDFTLARLDKDRFLLIGSPSAEAHYLRLLEKTRPAGVTVTNVSEAWGGIALSGPNARDLLARATNGRVGSLKLFQGQMVNVGTVEALALRINFTGENGYELYAPAARLRAIHSVLVVKGAALGVQHYGVDAFDLRFAPRRQYRSGCRSAARPVRRRYCRLPFPRPAAVFLWAISSSATGCCRNREWISIR
jgi:dimethylglycine dehydrogenase